VLAVSRQRQQGGQAGGSMMAHGVPHTTLSALSFSAFLAPRRAVRAQQFIAFTRRDMEARKAKAAALEKELYPDNTKVCGRGHVP